MPRNNNRSPTIASRILDYVIEEWKHAAPSRIVRFFGTTLLVGYLVNNQYRLERRLKGMEAAHEVYVQKLKINAEETAAEAEKWAELDKEIAAIRIPSESEPLF